MTFRSLNGTGFVKRRNRWSVFRQRVVKTVPSIVVVDPKVWVYQSNRGKGSVLEVSLTGERDGLITVPKN